MQAQIVIKELSEITENKSTNGGDGDSEELPTDTHSNEHVDNRTLEVI